MKTCFWLIPCPKHVCVCVWMMMKLWYYSLISHFFTLYSVDFHRKHYFYFKKCDPLSAFDLSVLQIKPTFKHFITKKKEAIYCINKDIFICIIFSGKCFAQFSKDKQHFPCNLSQPCACLQAFVILEPMREMQMMNIHSYLALTMWLVLYAQLWKPWHIAWTKLMWQLKWDTYRVNCRCWHFIPHSQQQ